MTLNREILAGRGTHRWTGIWSSRNSAPSLWAPAAGRVRVPHWDLLVSKADTDVAVTELRAQKGRSR